jgi:hypothetical protein
MNLARLAVKSNSKTLLSFSKFFLGVARPHLLNHFSAQQEQGRAGSTFGANTRHNSLHGGAARQRPPLEGGGHGASLRPDRHHDRGRRSGRSLRRHSLQATLQTGRQGHASVSGGEGAVHKRSHLIGRLSRDNRSQ